MAVFIVKIFKFNYFNTDPFLIFPKQKQNCLFRCVKKHGQIAKTLTGCSCLQVEDFQRYAIAELLTKASSLQREGVLAWAPHCHLALQSLLWTEESCNLFSLFIR